LPDRLAALLPFPRLVRPQPGHCTLAPDTSVEPGSGAGEAADAVRRVLAALPWPADRPTAPGAGIRVEVDGGLGAEAYRLRIGPEHVRVMAGGPHGAFYAAQTIKQLLPDDAWRAAPVSDAKAWTIPCAEIADAPALAWRGAHLDVARHFFAKPVLLRFIDMLAAHKLNRLHLHLTDDQGWRIESRHYPALHEVGSHRPGTQVGKDRTAHDHKPHGGYYTLADLAEINAYAAQRMVSVVPELEVPGHARALLAARPELAAAPGRREQSVATQWGIFPHIMSPLPATLDVLTDLFGELLGAIPASFVHIGGDECVLTDWAADPRIEAHRKSLGLASPEALHAYFLRQVADLLADRFGTRAIVWDEGFSSTESGAGLRPDTVVMAWHGMDVAGLAAEAGYDVIAAPMMPTYFDNAQAEDDSEPLSIGGLIRVEDVAAFHPVPDGWDAGAAGHLLGAQFQLWTEYISDSRALDYMTYPRACAFAEVVWSGTPASWTSDPVDAAAHAGAPVRPPLRDRVEADLARLTAAGVEFRPLTGPQPGPAAR
jgi:hexosaminidase